MVKQETLLVQEHSGPLPAPWTLAGYEEVTSGAAERIIVMAEKQQEHGHTMQKAAHAYEVSMGKGPPKLGREFGRRFRSLPFGAPSPSPMSPRFAGGLCGDRRLQPFVGGQEVGQAFALGLEPARAVEAVDGAVDRPVGTA